MGHSKQDNLRKVYSQSKLPKVCVQNCGGAGSILAGITLVLKKQAKKVVIRMWKNCTELTTLKQAITFCEGTLPTQGNSQGGNQEIGN